MRTSRTIKSAVVPFIIALVSLSLSCCPVTVMAQGANPPAYSPPPDQTIYFRTGPKERSVGVTVTNFNVPGLPYNLTYLRQTIEALEDIGYEVPETPASAAVQVSVTAKYTEVDNSKAVANEVGGKAVAGAVLGALTGLALGGRGRGAALGAAGGAAFGVASGSSTPQVLRYLTLEFNVSSRKGGSQIGQVTKDITDLDIGMEEFIDAAIADYLEAAFPKR